MEKEKVSKVVTVTVVERPARKLIFLRHITATDYFSACEEAGCEWEGNFKSIPETFISRIDSDPIRSEEEKNSKNVTCLGRCSIWRKNTLMW